MADLTRHEQFLNHIAHPDEPCPKPQTRTEFLLKEIAENKDGGGGQFIIAVTPNDEQTELSVDKTYQEIASAFAEGKTFYFYYSYYSTPFAANCVREDDDTYSIEGVYISLDAVSEDTAEIGVLKIEVTADFESGIVAYSEHSFVSGTYSSIPPGD